MINKTALQHPTIKRKIRYAYWLAKLEAAKKAKEGYAMARGTRYVENRKGRNILRVDCFYANGYYQPVAWGDQSRNITHLITPIIGAN